MKKYFIKTKEDFIKESKKIHGEMQKAGNKSLDYSFRTYESNAANKMMTDDTVRLLGKYKNK
jgi:hypothetical protein